MGRSQTIKFLIRFFKAKGRILSIDEYKLEGRNAPVRLDSIRKWFGNYNIMANYMKGKLSFDNNPSIKEAVEVKAEAKKAPAKSKLAQAMTDAAKADEDALL